MTHSNKMTPASVLGRLVMGATALVSCLLMASANAGVITVDNTRMIYMNGHYSNGGSSESNMLYSIHTTRQENLLVNFDLSNYGSSVATGDALVVFDIIGHYNTANTIEVRQLNQYNTNVDLDNSGSYFRDAASAGGTLQWIDNNGNALGNLNYNNSVLDITSSLLTSVVADPSQSLQLSFSIAQADVQSWLDGVRPSTVVLTMDNSPWSYYIFDIANASVEVEGASVPAPSMFWVMAFASLMLPLVSRKQRHAHV